MADDVDGACGSGRDVDVPRASVDGEGGGAVDGECLVECALSGEQCRGSKREHRERNGWNDDCSAKMHDGASVFSGVPEYYYRDKNFPHTRTYTVLA